MYSRYLDFPNTSLPRITKSTRNLDAYSHECRDSQRLFYSLPSLFAALLPAHPNIPDRGVASGRCLTTQIFETVSADTGWYAGLAAQGNNTCSLCSVTVKARAFNPQSVLGPVTIEPDRLIIRIRNQGMNMTTNMKGTAFSAAAQASDSPPLSFRKQSDGALARKLAYVLAGALLAFVVDHKAFATTSGLVYSGAEPSFNNCSANAASAIAGLNQIEACTSPTQIYPQEDPIWAVASDDGVAGGQWSWTLTTTYEPCCGGGGVNGPNYGPISSAPAQYFVAAATPPRAGGDRIPAILQ
jgi:hypothetical protein